MCGPYSMRHLCVLARTVRKNIKKSKNKETEQNKKENRTDDLKKIRDSETETQKPLSLLSSPHRCLKL